MLPGPFLRNLVGGYHLFFFLRFGKYRFQLFPRNRLLRLYASLNRCFRCLLQGTNHLLRFFHTAVHFSYRILQTGVLVIEHVIQKHGLFMIFMDFIQHSIGVFVDRHDLLIGQPLQGTLCLLHGVSDRFLYRVVHMMAHPSKLLLHQSLDIFPGQPLPAGCPSLIGYEETQRKYDSSCNQKDNLHCLHFLPSNLYHTPVKLATNFHCRPPARHLCLFSYCKFRRSTV